MAKKKYDHTFAIVALEARKRREEEKNAPKPGVRLRAALVKLRLAGYKGRSDLGCLIDACGPKLLLLQQHLSNYPDKRWEAGSYWLNRSEQEFGHTPDEALAHLLTALILRHG